MPLRLAFIVSHPIQYYAPLYRRLAARDDVQIKVFFTWHGGESAQLDRGFGQRVAWDIPLTDGYDFQVVPNMARQPGTHHFFGLRNPTLVKEVLAWRPDAVHLTGYPYASHLSALRALHRARVPVLFRGDSHLLDGSSGLKWSIKRSLLRSIYRWPASFLYVGQANRSYYERLGVPAPKLFHCPHSIEVSRFAEPNDKFEAGAQAWRTELGVKNKRVLLFAGKFEPKKQPLQLMDACLGIDDPSFALIMVGNGPLASEVARRADAHSERFRLLPFQNQSRMPLVYRLGDVFTLPSGWGETWGLAVNEALACGRPVLISDKVGCASDVVQPGVNGHIFQTGDWAGFGKRLSETFGLTGQQATIQETARRFDISETERTLVESLRAIIPPAERNVPRVY